MIEILSPFVDYNKLSLETRLSPRPRGHGTFPDVSVLTQCVNVFVRACVTVPHYHPTLGVKDLDVNTLVVVLLTDRSSQIPSLSCQDGTRFFPLH